MCQGSKNGDHKEKTVEEKPGWIVTNIRVVRCTGSTGLGIFA